jgi:DnaJ-domain-containing protein 1
LPLPYWLEAVDFGHTKFGHIISTSISRFGALDLVMSDRLVISLSPELEELQRKAEELSALEADLVQGELDLATTHGELQNFEREYQQIIGTRYAELERIEIQIAEYMAYLESNRDFNPSEDIKQIYRQVAKLIHPDLTTDPQQKIVRQQLMTEANQAYEDGNIDRLREILRSWESRPEAVEGEGIEAELIRITRKIAQCRDRLHEIRQEIAEIEQTELYQLQVEVSTARENGKDLLVEMAKDIDEQIAKAQEELTKIKEELGAR